MQSAAVLLAVALAQPAGAVEIGVQEATRCLSGELEGGRDGWRCLDVLAAPCAETASPALRADCITSLARDWSAYTHALLDRLEGRYAAAEMAEIRAAVAELRAAATERCRDLPETAMAQGRPAAPLGECLLHGAALLAHLLEFHPSRLISRPEAET